MTIAFEASPFSNVCTLCNSSGVPDLGRCSMRRPADGKALDRFSPYDSLTNVTMSACWSQTADRAKSPRSLAAFSHLSTVYAAVSTAPLLDYLHPLDRYPRLARHGYPCSYSSYVLVSVLPACTAEVLPPSHPALLLSSVRCHFPSLPDPISYRPSTLPGLAPVHCARCSSTGRYSSFSDDVRTKGRLEL